MRLRVAVAALLGGLLVVQPAEAKTPPLIVSGGDLPYSITIT